MDVKSSPEHVYIGMCNKTGIGMYDANHRKIDRHRTLSVNAQSNLLGPVLETFVSFPNLCELILMNNGLTDNDVEKLTTSSSLKVLDLSDNKLVTVPLDPDKGLKNVQKLLLWGNKNLNIEACIEHLVGFRKLSHLDLSQTNIQTVSEEIRKIQTLEYLNISQTQIVEDRLPIGVFSLCRLKTLVTNEEYGRYSSEVLEEFLKDQILDRLSLQPCNGVISWKYSRGHVVEILKQVKDAERQGKWPTGSVTELWLNTSKLGDLSTVNRDKLFQYLRMIRGFKDIKLISLCTNYLYEIPTLRHFDNLRQLGICRNNLVTIPSHVLSLPNLTHLYLTENRIEHLEFRQNDLPSIEFIDLVDNPLCRHYSSARKCIESRSQLSTACSIKGLEQVIQSGEDLDAVDVEDKEDVTMNCYNAVSMTVEFIL